MKYRELMNSFGKLIDYGIAVADDNNIKFNSLKALMSIHLNNLDNQSKIVEFISNKKRKTSNKEINAIKVYVTNAINELENAGLVKRIRSDEDKRIKKIVLTTKGVNIAKKIEEEDYV